MRRLPLLLVLLVPLLFAGACKGGKSEVHPQQARPFPTVELPSILTNADERLEYTISHYWDNFTDPTLVFTDDSLLLNGCSSSEVQQHVSSYVAALNAVPLDVARNFISSLFDRLEKFQLSHPGSKLFHSMTELLEKYLYDPNSPSRNEDLWLVYLRKLLSCELTSSDMIPSYEFDLSMCSLNQTGTKAADVEFTDLSGKKHRLYDVRADYILLSFSNPECNQCKETSAKIQANPLLGEMLEEGKLKIVNIYVDEDLDAWRNAALTYPDQWISGYDHNHVIRSNLTYSLRAIPSLYLLDSNMIVVMKDAPEDRILEYLSWLSR